MCCPIPQTWTATGTLVNISVDASMTVSGTNGSRVISLAMRARVGRMESRVAKGPKCYQTLVSIISC